MLTVTIILLVLAFVLLYLAITKQIEIWPCILIILVMLALQAIPK